MKKLLLVMLGLSFIIAGCGGSTDSDSTTEKRTIDGEKYISTATKLNVRDSASTDGEIVGQVAIGNRVLVEKGTETSGDDSSYTWVKIHYGDISGFVAKKFLMPDTDKAIVHLKKKGRVIFLGDPDNPTHLDYRSMDAALKMAEDDTIKFQIPKQKGDFFILDHATGKKGSEYIINYTAVYSSRGKRLLRTNKLHTLEAYYNSPSARLFAVEEKILGTYESQYTGKVYVLNQDEIARTFRFDREQQYEVYYPEAGMHKFKVKNSEKAPFFYIASTKFLFSFNLKRMEMKKTAIDPNPPENTLLKTKGITLTEGKVLVTFEPVNKETRKSLPDVTSVVSTKDL
jgi:uncharacterized protein YgiM (DUF1202 family)